MINLDAVFRRAYDRFGIWFFKGMKKQLASLETYLMRCRTRILVLLALACPLAVSAADWPQWRGPHQNGAYPEN